MSNTELKKQIEEQIAKLISSIQQLEQSENEQSNKSNEIKLKGFNCTLSELKSDESAAYKIAKSHNHTYSAIQNILQRLDAIEEHLELDNDEEENND